LFLLKAKLKEGSGDVKGVEGLNIRGLEGGVGGGGGGGGKIRGREGWGGDRGKYSAVHIERKGRERSTIHFKFQKKPIH
jgi:hypothetical protein